MADTAVKEGGEGMNEIATVMNEEEFGYFPFEQIGHQIEYEKFKMLHEVIEEADLEDEYQEWRQVYGYVE